MNKKIALNTLFLTSASFISKFIAYLYFIILTKNFSPEKIGIFGVLITSLLFMELFSAFGTDKILIREISKGEEIYWWYCLFFRTITTIIVFLIFIFIFKFIYKNLMSKYSLQIFLFMLSIFFINFYKNIEAYYIAKEKMLINSIGQIIEKTGILISSLGVMYHIVNFKKFLCLFFFVELLTFLFYLIIFLKNKNLIPYSSTINHSKIKYFLKESFSMFLLEIIAIIYFRIDIFMLSKMTDMKTTGLYHVAYKIFEFFITFFSGFLLAIFPHFSKKGKTIKPVKFIIPGIIILIPIVLGGIIFRNQILLIFNNVYEKASETLTILLITVPFIFINSLMVNYFIANGLQKFIVKFGIFLILTNIVLNFFLIPLFSLNGAAISTLICEILLTTIFIYFYVLTQKELLKKGF